ncbi:MAG TPA: energy transducer TonB [Candidatus Angelobacter sp.]|nr:energy transducer TonB [Candidatus Angelobacter sp.]
MSAFAHLAVLALIALFYRNLGPIIAPARIRATQVASGRNFLSFSPAKSRPNRPSFLPAPAHRPKRRAPKAEVAADSNGDSVAVIRQKAIKTTAALVQNFKLRTTFGVMPNDVYSVAVQTEGAPPQISADDLPPRYEQYLVVELTISIDGKVVDARLITGLVDRRIQDRVLAAVREYKYIPAKHNGSPIPSQLDIVVHVPS